MGTALRKLKPSIMANVKKPLVVVVGESGAGKSKLALDIATKCNGEVISADAMQVYKGLDIVTNKVTDEELKLCPHHMIGFLSPSEQFSVVDFRNQALEIIKDLHKRETLPILVGGTNYYVESILFDTLLQTKTVDREANDDLRKELNNLSNMELHKRLCEVDPNQAAFYHPNDKRKVVRALEVFYQTGKPMSEHLAEQRQEAGGSSIGGPLRFPNSCVLWVQCEADVLKERVYRRVDKMIQQGLLQELSDFHDEFNKDRIKSGLERDYEDGIFQSIGFKEFHKYLTTTSTSETKKNELFETAVERMKLSTWQYTKYQKRWITKRLVNRPESISVYSLDATFPEDWDENVLIPALRVIKDLYSNYPSVISHLLDVPDDGTPSPKPIEKESITFECKDKRKLKTCDVCGCRAIAMHCWEDHIKSKKHKRNYGKWKKQLQTTSQILVARQKQLSVKATDEQSTIFCEESHANQNMLEEDETIPWDILESKTDKKEAHVQ